MTSQEMSGLMTTEGGESDLPIRQAGDHLNLEDDAARTAADDQAELVITVEVPETGDPELDEMLQSLASSAALSPAEQLPVIEAVHRGLQDRLADTEG